MSRPVRKIAIVIALVMTIAAHDAAAAADFYVNLLRRGISEFNAGRFSSASTLLRTAAFGLLESVDQFETAQAYIAVASQRLGRDDDARHATRRILMAERIQRRFAVLPLPADLRAEFSEVARRYLTGAEHAALTDPSAAPAPRPDASTVRRRTITPAPETKAAATAPEPRQSPAVKPATNPPAPPQPGIPQPAETTIAEKTPPDPSPAEAPEPDKLVNESTVPAAPPARTGSAAAAAPPPKGVEVREPVPVAATQEKPAAAAPQLPPAAPADARPKDEPVKAEPVKPESVKPEPVKPEPVKPEPVKPEPVKPEPVKPAITPETPKADPVAQPPAARPAEPASTSRVEKVSPASEPRPQTPAVTSPPPAAAAAPPQEAIRQAQREFERKVAEVEKSQATPATKPVPPPDVTRALEEAAAALDRKDVFAARAKLRAVFAAPNLRRADLLKVAEEAYRAQDFALSFETFERAGALQPGEEPYGYYHAVALYETGRYAAAKAALARALPHIEVTDDVARYRAKIEGAVN